MRDTTVIDSSVRGARLANANLWMERQGKRPEPDHHGNYWRWQDPTSSARHCSDAAVLPIEVFDELIGGFRDSGVKCYLTREEAVQALADALADLAEYEA